MKCRVDIKRSIIKTAINEFESKRVKRVTFNSLMINNAEWKGGSQQAYRVANSIANAANRMFKNQIARVVPVMHGQEIIFEPSQKLITIYQKEYLRKQAADVQKADAERAGVEYSDDYLFGNEDIKAEEDLFLDMDNLNFTNDVLDYLYQNSSKRLTFLDYRYQVTELSDMLRGAGYNNTDILDKIKCL